MCRERDIAEYESARNKAADEFFDARPKILVTKLHEDMFEAGFRKAWEYLKAKEASMGVDAS